MSKWIQFCENCKQVEVIYLESGHSDQERKELGYEQLENLGWVKMNESEDLTFFHFLCPRCK